MNNSIKNILYDTASGQTEEPLILLSKFKITLLSLLTFRLIACERERYDKRMGDSSDRKVRKLRKSRFTL